MSHKRKHSTADRNAASAFVAADELQPRRAFSVSGAPDYTDDAPQTAEEYLRRVKWEARHQPRVFTSTIDPRRFDHLQTKGYVQTTQPLPHTSARVMPSAEWESEFASQFADIRLSCAHYSQLHPAAAQQPRPPTGPTLSAVVADDSITAPRNIEAWARYCLGLSTATARPPTPSLPTVAAFDQLTTRGVLAQIVSHLQQAVTRAETQQQRNNQTTTYELEQAKGGQSNNAGTAELTHNMQAERDGDEDEDEEEEEEGGENSSQPAISLQPSSATSDSSSSRFDPLSALSVSTTRWLYCLLAHLQKPLPSETEVHLRQLYRVCGTIRAEAGKRVDKSDDSRQPVESKQHEIEQQADTCRAAEETAMWCNMLLTIVDRIFGQRIPLQVIPTS